jgi:hypothetical protein
MKRGEINGRGGIILLANDLDHKSAFEMSVVIVPAEDHSRMKGLI